MGVIAGVALSFISLLGVLLVRRSEVEDINDTLPFVTAMLSFGCYVFAVTIFMVSGRANFAIDEHLGGGKLPRGAVIENLHTVEYSSLPAENKSSLGNYSILKFPNGSLYSYRLEKKPPDGCFMVEDTPTGTNFRKLPCTE